MKHSTQCPDEATSDSSGVKVHPHQGSLRSKLVLSLGAMFFVFLTIDELVRQQVIEPEFTALERSGGIRDANRVLAAMNAEVEHLNTLALHWASRIEEGAADKPSSFLQSEAKHGTWKTHKINWAAYVTDANVWNWIKMEGSPQVATDLAIVRDQFESLVKVSRESQDRSFAGMTRIGDHSLVMFSVVGLEESPNTTLHGNAKYLVVGRQFDESLVTTLRQQTQVEFTLQPPRTSSSANKLKVWEANASTLIVEIQITGVHQQKLANIHIRVPRDITARSKRTTQLARNSFIFGSVAAFVMLLLLLQRIVISPLTLIREYSNRIAKRGLASEPLALTRNDEIGHLAGSFDQMLGRLGDTQTQLANASRDAGRSQVASTVIHNVGNVLTNVNSLIDAASDRVNGLRIQPLDRLADRLKQEDIDTNLLEATPDYLEGLASSLKHEQETIRELLKTLHDNVRHIHDVIHDQQRHADLQLKLSRVLVKEVIEESIACCNARLEEDEVKVRVVCDPSIHVWSDRSLLLQIVINIIGNARQAMRNHDSINPPRLQIVVTETDAIAVIQFRDNGCGMDAPTIQQIFDAHFTTRESGFGLGLHFCAITLKRMGGSIAATSEGIGRGSTIKLEIPTHISNELENSRLTPQLRGTQA